MTEPRHHGLHNLVEIGRGGFGVVYRARQDRFDRDVALKLIDARPDPKVRGRFAQECRALGQLSGHPHIVSVHDGGIDADGRAFLIMPFHGRGSLLTRLHTQGALDWREVVDIGVRLAGALQTAHDAGILHRDLKPANILIDEYGAPRLADFGQARLADAELSRAGETAITPGYAAPEVLSAGPATVCSDVYSLAATLLALLLGRSPFDGDGDLAAVCFRVVSQPPPDIRPLGVPGAVAAVLEQALAKAPEGRFHSAAAFGTALQVVQRTLGLPPAAMTIAGRPQAALPPVEAAPHTAWTSADLEASPRTPPVSLPDGVGGAIGLAARDRTRAEQHAWPSQPPPRQRPPRQPSPGQPARQQRPQPQQPPVARHRSRQPLVVGLLALLLLGGVCGLASLTDGQRPAGLAGAADSMTTGAGAPQSPTGAPSETGAPGQTGSQPTASGASPSSTPAASGTPSTVGSPTPRAGDVDASAVASDPAAAPVGETLTTYFLGINNQNYAEAFAVFSPAFRAPFVFDEWAAGLVTTQDSRVRVTRLERPDERSLHVFTSFTSRQSAEYGRDGQTCSLWTLRYTLVPSVDGPTPYQIDGVEDDDPGPAPC